jgi:hypothetical protein
MRAVSKKRARLLRERRKVTDAMNPVCVRCGARADDAHEILSRARGGSITDPANVVPLCRADHDWVTNNPRAAHAEGLSKHSWEGA